MNNSKRLGARLIHPTAACTLTAVIAVIAAWTLTAPGAPPEDRYALARKSYRGVVPITPIPKSLADKPEPRGADTITPNTPHWNLPPARPGAEPPSSDKSRLLAIHSRREVLAPEHPVETYADQPYPQLHPTTALAWSPFPKSSELSVPPVLSGPDGLISSDPTAVQSHQAVLAGRAILRQTPVRFLRLNIPDPFGLVDAVKMAPG
ncbi:MAG: hypothetical protein QGH94_09210, partial [Phycisphaerae bacterium]|nr:hypothetical protein [Phycisphaerae bacterium]